jgi:hypothetical protein
MFCTSRPVRLCFSFAFEIQTEVFLRGSICKLLKAFQLPCIGVSFLESFALSQDKQIPNVI